MISRRAMLALCLAAMTLLAMGAGWHIAAAVLAAMAVLTAPARWGD